jgi:hypothetical protein
MAMARPPMIDDDGTGTTGTVLNNAWYQALCDAIDASVAVLGKWTDVPYSAGNFTTPSGTWTVPSGSISQYAWSLSGKTLVLSFSVTNTTVTGTPQWLGIALPAGFLTTNLQDNRCAHLIDNGVAVGTGFVRTDGSAILKVFKDIAGTNFVASSGLTTVTFTATLRLS